MSGRADHPSCLLPSPNERCERSSRERVFDDAFTDLAFLHTLTQHGFGGHLTRRVL